MVGGGGAGFCAAIEAANAGASVLVLEKAGFCGGNTQLSNGMLMAAGTKEQLELAGCDTDTPEAFAEQQVAYAQGHGDAEMIRDMCLHSPEAVEFMTGLGRVYADCSIIPPVWTYDTDTSWGPRSHWDHHGVETAPDGHFGTLRRVVAGMDAIRVKTETEVAHLVVENGEVVGVTDTLGNAYRADKGVVIATASFDNNKEMCRRYNHMYYWALCLGEKYGADGYGAHAGNTGDGIRMAQEIGADLATTMSNVTLDAMYCGGVGAYYYNTENGVDHTNPYLSTAIPGKILVNSLGNRFVQEDALWGYVNHACYEEAMRTNWNAETSPIGVWGIQDTVNMAIDVLSMGYAYGQGAYNSLCQSADTLEELAEKIGCPADALLATVERWNDYSRQGKDPEFDRRTDFGTIEVGPFYAYPYIPQTMGSHGGLRADIDARIIDVNGNPIPRLYGAGTVISGMWCGPFYPSCGWAILGTVHWGRKAGANVAALDPWTTDPVVPAEPVVPEARAAQPGSYKVGVYQAESVGRNGSVAVTVEFSDDAIVAVTVGENMETPEIGSAALDILPGRIAAAQGTDVDALCGATMSSMALFRAVDDCINQAKA